MPNFENERPEASADCETDVLIVGSGIMGSAVAAEMRAGNPRLRIVMIDGGPAIGATPGLHLHDLPDPEIWAEYNERVSSGIQGFYAGAVPRPTAATEKRGLEAGIHLLSSLGDETDQMPMAAASWNVGGMGAHWTAATPTPAGAETFAWGHPDVWAQDLLKAQRLLRVRTDAFPPTVVGEHVLGALQQRYAGIGPTDRMPQVMPMAIERKPDGHGLRTGPSRIFPPIGGHCDPNFTLLPSTLAATIDHDGARASGAVVLDVATEQRFTIRAAAVVVCADTFRTPQLLHASGIRPEALGRYLNEHALITGRVLLDLSRAGIDLQDLPQQLPGEFATDSLWLPPNGPDQPFHWQIMNSTYHDEAGAPLAHSIGFSLYTPVESRPENRIRFSDKEIDLTGLPSYSVEYSRTPTDLALIDAATRELAAVTALFGAFDADTESALLPAGASLHPTGTVRAGAEDDGTSVTDQNGRVWGHHNLFLAGNGVIPTSMVANTTLTATITAVRAARAALALLEDVLV